jgi:hypothetical protein
MAVCQGCGNVHYERDRDDRWGRVRELCNTCEAAKPVVDVEKERMKKLEEWREELRRGIREKTV